MATSEPLSIHLRLEGGVGELRVEPEHPVVGAFRRGIEEGLRTGKWRFLLFDFGFDDGPTILGTLVRTPRGHFLFFPGARIQLDSADLDERFQGQVLDHLTLDPPRRSDEYASHIAVRDLPHRESRGANYRAPKPDGLLFPWFSMLLDGLGGFTPMPRHLWVQFPSPREDVHAYGEHLMDDGGFLYSPAPDAPDCAHFLQIDVWVGHGPDWKTRGIYPLAWAYKPELVRDA